MFLTCLHQSAQRKFSVRGSSAASEDVRTINTASTRLDPYPSLQQHLRNIKDASGSP